MLQAGYRLNIASKRRRQVADKSTNRTGRVSAVDYKRGTYEVTYSDRGQSVTRQINAVSNGEYKMPNVGDMVSVLHSSNGTAAGVAIGTVWNETNPPAEGFKGLYRKEFGIKNGQAYERYDANSGEYTLCADGSIKIQANGAVIAIASDGSIDISSPASIEIVAPSVNIAAGNGDIRINGINLSEHIHDIPGGKTGKPE